MTTAPVEPRGLPGSDDSRWTRGRWWAAIAVIFAGQLALIFLLQGRPAGVPVKHAAVPAIHWTADGPGEWLALKDPTLFVLPHREGFSGDAWLRTPGLTHQTPAWSEPMRPLTLAAENLGTLFQQVIQAGSVSAFREMLPDTEPTTTSSGTESLLTGSTFHLEGELIHRRLLSVFPLRPWANADLLTNTVVRLLVDAHGDTVSAALLPPGCGKTEADQSALALAKAARFEPVETPIGERTSSREPALMVGTIIFEWQTLPLTNAPAAP